MSDSNNQKKYSKEALACEILEQLKDKGLTVGDITKSLDRAKELISLTEFTGIPPFNQRWPQS